MSVPDDSLEALGSSALRWLLVAGEALPPELVSGHGSAVNRDRTRNAYGPTECSR